MTRRLCLGIAAFALIFAGAGAQAPAPIDTHAANPVQGARTEGATQWVVSGSEGLEALLLIGLVGGDVLQSEIFGETASFLREGLDADTLAAMDRIDRRLRVEGRRLTGPTLAYLFSAGDLSTLQSVLRSARDPDRHLRAGLRQSQGWDPARYEEFVSLTPDIAAALEGLEAFGFSAWYAETMAPLIEEAAARNRTRVSSFDIIPEQQRLLGRPLEPRIELIITRFNAPYGIRILGQRYVGNLQWDPDIQLRVAAHEIFHPPFDRNDPALLDRLSALREDPWVRSIVENHNPAFGYNTFLGLVDEDSAQAMDQIVSERMGFARNPGRRWAVHDDGMHMLAAAFYHAMKEDGFDETGGVYQNWLMSAIDRGLLTPDEVRRRAAEIVGEDAVMRWYDELET